MTIIDARDRFPGPAVDPEEEITVTMTKGHALALMEAIMIVDTDYEETEDTPLLHDAHMWLSGEVWGELD